MAAPLYERFAIYILNQKPVSQVLILFYVTMDMAWPGWDDRIYDFFDVPGWGWDEDSDDDWDDEELLEDGDEDEQALEPEAEVEHDLYDFVDDFLALDPW